MLVKSLYYSKNALKVIHKVNIVISNVRKNKIKKNVEISL